MLTQLKVDSPLSVLGISKHFVAIYGANHGQEGASLLLYNTQYKVIKTKQFFKVYFNFSQLWSIDEHILLAMGQNLSVVKYRVLKEVLSELVGTQVGHDYQNVIEDIHINEEAILEDCLQYSTELQQSNNKNDPKIPKTNIEEADGNYIAFLNTKKFDKELNELRHLNLHVDVLQVDQPLDDVQISLMSNYNDNGFISPEIQIIARQLENSGASEHEITEKLLTVLMKANLLQDIAVCLRRYNNISEKILSKTLNYLLKQINSVEDLPEDKQLTNGSSKEEHMDVDVNLKIEAKTEEIPNLDLLAEKYTEQTAPTEVIDILNILLTCSFDPQVITKHIRKDVEYEKILIILKHLYNLLISPKFSLLEERPSLNPSSTDYELQLLRWFGVFLDSHFQKLALSKDVQLMELLFKWHQLFESYKREIVNLETVGALLYNILAKKETIKQQNTSKWYSIEEIKLF